MAGYKIFTTGNNRYYVAFENEEGFHSYNPLTQRTFGSKTTATKELNNKLWYEQQDAKREQGIVMLNGAYEVHPSKDGNTWKVVNGETGQVRSSYSDKAEAIAAAEELNA